MHTNPKHPSGVLKEVYKVIAGSNGAKLFFGEIEQFTLRCEFRRMDTIKDRVVNLLVV